MKDHLRNAPAPTDVTFVFHVFQGERREERKHVHDVVFPAHRDRLLVVSEYFASLITGDWKHTDEVSIEDCKPGAFRILLRWIYRTVLKEVQRSTFVAVLLAAERFGLKDLVSSLIGLAEQLLTAGFCYEILSMLEHLQLGCAKALTKKCLKYFDKNAVALVGHASFRNISKEVLMKVLDRSALCAREIDLYRAAIKWAESQLKGANKRRTHKAIREVLGDALFLIRFPTMHPQEFTYGPVRTTSFRMP